MSLADIVHDVARGGDTPPEPLARRRFSSEFVARVPRALRRRPAIEAAAAGVSRHRMPGLKPPMPLGAVAPAPARAGRRPASGNAARRPAR
ncbi:MAG TPA: hypothetical protein VND19_11050 [Acetobacteraceae bacterium]|nr:hypothetical protein [Acetobacteraceae bacterium]